jgi:hypothetical protein
MTNDTDKIVAAILAAANGRPGSPYTYIRSYHQFLNLLQQGQSGKDNGNVRAFWMATESPKPSDYRD